MFAKKPGLNRKAGPPVHDDLVARQFYAQDANQVWLTGHHRASPLEPGLYLCAIKVAIQLLRALNATTTIVAVDTSPD